jgi:signal transduction histidine kinase
VTSLAKRLARAPAPLLLGVLVLLLGALATLQYRWAGELVQADRARMQVGAKARAEAMARDLDREITRAVFRLQLDAALLEGRDFSSYADRLDAWRRQAAFPDLAGDVYLVEREDQGGALRLERFDARRRTFVAAEWPAALAGVKARVTASIEPFAPERTWRHGPFDLIADDVPALLIPVRGTERGPTGPGQAVAALGTGPRPDGPRGEGPRFDVHVQGRLDVATAAGGSGGRVTFWRPDALTIVVLDGDVLRGRVLPLLAERHFSGEYDLAVVREEEPRAVVWRSRPEAGPVGSGDAAAGLLGLRLDEMGEQDFEARREARVLRERPEPRGASEPAREVGPFRRLSGPPRPGGPRLEHTGHWRLVATHSAGSIDTVVGAARRRNLGISFGILVLLGGSAALLVSAARRAERLGRRQMEFVAGVSHELRTPLAVIRSAGENLADGVVREAAQVKGYGALVRDEGRRLSEMVEEVLELAGADSRPPARAPVALPEVVEAALAACDPELRAHGITAETDVPEGLPPVLGDAAALRRAVRNLIENAIKYGGDARWIGLRAGTAAGRRGPEVWLSVADRGLGIPAHEAGRIFEPFFRGHEATARQIHGNGLGLSLVRRIAASHGGAVSVEKGAGPGSVFTLRLPAAAGGAP